MSGNDSHSSAGEMLIIRIDVSEDAHGLHVSITPYREISRLAVLELMIEVMQGVVKSEPVS